MPFARATFCAFLSTVLASSLALAQPPQVRVVLANGDAKPMDDERITTRWFTAKEVEQMLLSGKIMDAKTNIGFFRWQKYFARK